MKIVIFGLGSIGMRHARILQNAGIHDLYAFRSRRSGLKNSIGIPELHTWEEVESIKPDVAFITNPTALHIQTAHACVRLKMHLFIEKPLSNTMNGIALLERLCKKYKRACYVGYCLRFHPCMRKMKQLCAGKHILHARVVCSSYLPDWRPDRASRATYSAHRRLGGGVLLDLSHEFDYIQFLFGKIDWAVGMHGKTGTVTNDVEDFADVCMRIARNIPVNLHINFMSRMNERSIIVDTPHGYVRCDLIRNRVVSMLGGATRIYSYRVNGDYCYQKQMEYFFSHLRGPRPVNTISEARHIVEVIERLKHG
jgi:predicted dehydrogenase